MNLRKEIAIDLLTNPWTLIPAIGGLSCLLLWMGNGGPPGLLAKAGGLLLLGAIGSFTTQAVFGFQNMLEKVVKRQEQLRLQKEEERITSLRNKLRRDKDPRTQQLLDELKSLFSTFRKDVKSGKLTGYLAEQILETGHRMFEVCCDKLERTLKLRKLIKRAGNKKTKNMFEEEREEIISEVENAIVDLSAAIQKVHKACEADAVIENETGNLESLRDELEQTMDIHRNLYGDDEESERRAKLREQLRQRARQEQQE